jgi:hypothetical protein
MGDDELDEVPDVPMATVPAVVGFDAADACDMVRWAGLVPYGPDFGPARTTGVVHAQHPPGGATTTIGAAVFVHTEPGNLAPD